MSKTPWKRSNEHRRRFLEFGKGWIRSNFKENDRLLDSGRICMTDLWIRPSSGRISKRIRRRITLTSLSVRIKLDSFIWIERAGSHTKESPDSLKVGAGEGIQWKLGEFQDTTSKKSIVAFAKIKNFWHFGTTLTKSTLEKMISHLSKLRPILFMCLLNSAALAQLVVLDQEEENRRRVAAKAMLPKTRIFYPTRFLRPIEDSWWRYHMYG